MNSPELTLGQWRIQPTLNRLESVDGGFQSLDSKAMQVLVMLLKANGDVVSQDELLGVIWKDRVVEPGIVHQKIRAIRAALADDAKDPTYIETIHKRGYRVITTHSAVPETGARRHFYYWGVGTSLCVLLLSVFVYGFDSNEIASRDVRNAAPGETVWGLSTKYPREKRVAVLDFKDHSRDQNYTWFGKSLADEIRRRLTQGHKPHEVMPSLASKESLLDSGEYDFYISGSIQAKGKAVVVHVELVDRNNDVRWSDSKTETTEDLVELQPRLAGWIAGNTDLFMTDEKQYNPEDSKAAALFDKWPTLVANGDIDGTIEVMRQITKIEPSFLLAWNILGWNLLTSGQLRADPSLLEEARVIISSVSTRTNSPADIARGSYIISAFFEQDLPKAESFAREYAFLNGGSFFHTSMMSNAGLHEQALDQSRRHTEIAPFWNDGWIEHAKYAARAGRKDDVIWALKKAR